MEQKKKKNFFLSKKNSIWTWLTTKWINMVAFFWSINYPELSGTIQKLSETIQKLSGIIQQNLSKNRNKKKIVIQSKSAKERKLAWNVEAFCKVTRFLWILWRHSIKFKYFALTNLTFSQFKFHFVVIHESLCNSSEQQEQKLEGITCVNIANKKEKLSKRIKRKFSIFLTVFLSTKVFLFFFFSPWIIHVVDESTMNVETLA